MNKPIMYEDKMKDRDNEFLYNKCVKQYYCIMNYQFKMREYKNRIKELEEENKKLKDRIDKTKEYCGIATILHAGKVIGILDGE